MWQSAWALPMWQSAWTLPMWQSAWTLPIVAISVDTADSGNQRGHCRYQGWFSAGQESISAVPMAELGEKGISAGQKYGFTFYILCLHQ